MLHNFRVNAGLEPKAPVYGGWESEEPWVDIRCHGHTLGHYLSAASLMYASTGDARMKQRADYIVDRAAGLSEGRARAGSCARSRTARRSSRTPWRAGRSSACPGTRCTRCSPACAMRTSARRQRAGARRADGARGLDGRGDRADDRRADAAMLRTRTRRHERGARRRRGADRRAKYLELARRFSHEALLAPLAEARDPLDGLHANTQIPKVIGFQRIVELTGDERYRRAARFFWRTVVERRSFVTGGHGDNEHFFPPAEFAKHLGPAKTMETCCTHNMLRLTRVLFQAEPVGRVSRTTTSARCTTASCASQDPESGMMTYFQATRPGYVRLFHTPDRSFWCCTGTGMENHAKYGDSIYFHDADALWVNLFIPSVVTWKENGMRAAPDDRRFPRRRRRTWR